MANDVIRTALRTRRLLLRDWRPSDREPFAAMSADAEVMRYFVAPLTRSESDAFADRIEAGRAAMAYGFEVVGPDEVVSMTAAVNAPSRAVMERLGMTRDAADDFDHPLVPVGHPLRRHVLYRLAP